MTTPNSRRSRDRGQVETLPSGSLRVKVYAGVDPITKRRHYLTETFPPGPDAAKAAEKARVRLLSEVDQRRNPRTRATVNQLLDRWLPIVNVEPTTKANYVARIDKHTRPVIGDLPVSRLDAETLDSFYALLAQCRDHCGGKLRTEHRVAGRHRCDDRCRTHTCRPLGPASIRQIHWILSGALSRAVRWRWISDNPARHAEPPAPPAPDPDPPSPGQAALLINASWEQDADWGTVVWLAMTTGARRGELCALRWIHIDLDGALIVLRGAIGQVGARRWEKDTKTHQRRHIALDPETVEILREHRERWEARCAEMGIKPPADAFVFSGQPDGSTPLVPSTVTRRFKRLADRLDIDTHLHALRHYSATELIRGGADVRTVAGRLGHGGGGATTLRVYAAWVSESDQQAAKTLGARMPARPPAAPTAEQRRETQSAAQPRRTPPELEDRIEKLARNEGMGPKRIAKYLAEEGITIAHSTVWLVLKRRACTPSLLHPAG